MKEDYIKVQLAFEEDVDLKIREKGIPILDSSGVFYTVIVKREDLESHKWLHTLKPKIWNELPVNLEEVFIAKIGGKRRW